MGPAPRTATVSPSISCAISAASNPIPRGSANAAIEKGVQLDDVFIEKLAARESGNPEDYYIGGIICLAVALGLPFMGYFISKTAPEAFYPILGAGALVGLIAISLLLCGVMIARRAKAIKGGNDRM